MRILAIVVALVLVLAEGAQARADETEQRKRVALAAELCAANYAAADFLSGIKKRATVLLKHPLAEDLASEIGMLQESYQRNDSFILKLKEAMVAAHATSRPCGDKLIKKLVHCILFEAAGNSDGNCDREPDVAAFRHIDGVPELKYVDDEPPQPKRGQPESVAPPADGEPVKPPSWMKN